MMADKKKIKIFIVYLKNAGCYVGGATALAWCLKQNNKLPQKMKENTGEKT